ncbi:MAG: ABC transporter permease [Planctomycetota bacterium]|nr:MAG: ABC transporter permease [Planctomycetota bacterium]
MNILFFCLRKMVLGVIVILAVLTISFFMVRAIPGDPFASEKSANPLVKEVVRQKYGMDKPLIVQYFNFIQGAIVFDFGPSYVYRNWQVRDLLLKGFPVSGFLGFLALTIATFLGVFLGSMAAYRRNSMMDYLTMATVVMGICLPNFFLAPLLVIFFSLYLYWLPPAGWGGFSQLILPVFVLSLPYLAYISRLTRAGMIEVLGKDFIRTARAKGLPEYRVIFEHGLRNGIIPVVTFLGPAAAGIMTGSFVIETIFHIPGMGKYFISAFIHKDYGMILGSIFLYSVLLVFFNLLVDISYYFLNPRLQVP